MDERNEMREDGKKPFAVPPVPANGEEEDGRPRLRKLIRPERDEPADGPSVGHPDGNGEALYGHAHANPDGQGEAGDGLDHSRPDGNGKATHAPAFAVSDGRTGALNGRGAVKVPRPLGAREPEEREAPAGESSGGGLAARQRSGAGSGRFRSRRFRTASAADGQPGLAFNPESGRHPHPLARPGDRPEPAGQARGEDPQRQDLQPESTGDRPQAHDGQPQARDGQPQARNGQSHARDGQPLARNRRSRARNGRPETEDGQPPKAQDGQPQARDRQSPSRNRAPIPESLDEIKTLLEREAGLNASFDAVLREMTFGGRRTAFFYMNGLIDSSVLTEVLVRLSFLTSEDIDADVLKLFFETYVPAIQVTKTDSFDDMLDAVFAGNAAMFVDREGAALIIDVKMFPDRTPDEPSLERVVRGSRDGFVETLMTNVSLIRRRLRDRELRFELIRVGARTKTDVCIAYIRDIADPGLVEEVKRKIGQVNVYGLPLADKQLEETTVNLGWHPYPLVRYSERPDVVAAQLLEGSVAVLTDTTPTVMMLPTTFFDLTQHAEENRQTPFIGTYLRWIRYIGILFSLFLLPLWFLLVLKPELKPPALDFLGPQKMGRIPLFLQFLLAEIGVDLMRMAAVHTPTPLSTAMSLIAAILIGDIAVKTGLFNNEVILYMALAAIGMFATPNYELGLANRIVRLALIIAVALFGVPGFVVGTALFIVLLACTRSFDRPYLWPFIPFDGRSLAALLVRPPELQNKKRNPLLKPQQLDRLPNSQENA